MSKRSQRHCRILCSSSFSRRICIRRTFCISMWQQMSWMLINVNVCVFKCDFGVIFLGISYILCI
jgi:hypothetical protein